MNTMDTTLDSAMPAARQRPVASRRLARPLAMMLIAATLPLAACKRDAVITGTIYPDDYRQRHPIALTNEPETLDVFVGRNMAGLDARQLKDVRTLAQDFRQTGRGPITMYVPGGTSTPAASHRGAQAVRSALASAGVGGAYVRTATYQGSGDSLASPVRLSYVKLQAKVQSQCGDWSRDIGGVATTTDSWQNKNERNFGCAYQNMIAQQIDDPIDLQRPRTEDRSDVQRRMKVFDSVRSGADPGINWKSEGATVKTGS
ncbi:MAG: CpaD family pilus assembly protein [Alsobacter sp.]